MRPIPLILALILPLMPAAAQAATGATETPYAAIYDRVIQPDADAAVARCTALRSSLPKADAAGRLAGFTRLAEAWGRVQAVYVLGGYDAAAIDYPLLIDYFHSGKEDIPATIARLVATDASPARSLYKNSYRTLTALDAAMFGGEWSPRRATLSDAMLDTICARLDTIAKDYQAQRAAYLADPKKALSLTVNALILSAYKTRDWRIAQVAGLNKRSLGQYKPELAQFPASDTSWAVIGAILTTYQRLLDDDHQPNLATIARAGGAEKGLKAVQAALADAVAGYDAVEPADAFDLRLSIPVFANLQKMEKAFYGPFVLSLGISAVLLDADGD